MAAPVCSNVTLIDGAACYLNNILSPVQQKALIIYAKAKELAAIGGTDYTAALSTTLVSDAQTLTCGMRQAERDAARINLALVNAANAGATIPSSIQDKIASVNCLVSVDPERLDMIDLLLTCRLGIHADYPQS